jgi:hypothetical protein
LNPGLAISLRWHAAIDSVCNGDVMATAMVLAWMTVTAATATGTATATTQERDGNNNG